MLPRVKNSIIQLIIVPILIGGDFNIDLKSYSGLDKHADFLYVPYRPISGNLAKDLKNTFLFTVDSLQVTEYEFITCFNEFRIYEIFKLKGCKVPCYVSMFSYFENFELIENQNKDNFVKKNRGFVISEFVKTCDELIIGQVSNNTILTSTRAHLSVFD